MKKILLIEDDQIIRDSTAELLEFVEDYSVITAENGEIGFRKALVEIPDIIICDVMMPKTDGYEVLERLSLNPKTQFIPFIFLSAKTERKDVRKGMNLGADDYITKPFSEDELNSAIESRLAKASILKELRNVEEVYEDGRQLKNLNDLKVYFKSYGIPFSYENNKIVYEEGSRSKYVFLIEEGAVKSYKLNEQGKMLTTSIYKEDDFFGYTSFAKNIPYQDTSETIQPTKLVGVKKEKLITLLNKNHKVVLDLVDLLADNLKDIKDQLLDMAYSSVHKKTSVTLLKFAEKINCKSDDVIKISRQDLANVAGISTETLIRSLSKLKKEGIIEIDGRTIKILHLESLKTVE